MIAAGVPLLVIGAVFAGAILALRAVGLIGRA